jgi:hypothetical protein
MKIYFMGVAKHDLVGSYQEVHDWCAIWSALIYKLIYKHHGFNYFGSNYQRGIAHALNYSIHMHYPSQGIS